MNLLVLLGRKHLFLQFGQIHCSTMQAVRGQVEKLLFKYYIIKLVLTPMVLLFFCQQICNQPEILFLVVVLFPLQCSSWWVLNISFLSSERSLGNRVWWLGGPGIVLAAKEEPSVGVKCGLLLS